MTKSKKMSFIVLAFVILSAFTINGVMNWQIKDGYSIKFIGTDAEGNFEKISGNIEFDVVGAILSFLYL